MILNGDAGGARESVLSGIKSGVLAGEIVGDAGSARKVLKKQNFVKVA